MTLRLKEDQLEFLDERRLKVRRNWTWLLQHASDKHTVLHLRISAHQLNEGDLEKSVEYLTKVVELRVPL